MKKALGATEALKRLAVELQDLGWSKKDSEILVDNTNKAVNGGSYVLQKLRSDMGDVHGSRPTLEALVYDSAKWAALIVRLLRS